MGATIGGTIKDTIGCLIMNAIFPPLGTAGREGETTAKRETSRENGAGNGKGILYPIRLPRKCYRMTNMYISCVLTI